MVLAERFTRLAGAPPMSCLTAWRMQSAARSLRESRCGIAQIAAAVGHESEATSTRTFKREIRVAPERNRCQPQP